MPTGVLLTSPQVATRLGCSVRTVHRMVKDNLLQPAQKLPGPNGAFLFDEDVVQRTAVDRAAA